ncbi:MAG: T9SS C-terminal target domain-containing protein [Bacteroidetes bacterium]|nr:MAG: T9SS C-terminal target domain-containing protein [Bacteroidota bacterium]
MKRIVTAVFLTLPALVLSGQQTYQVNVTVNVFSPGQLTINVGDKVVWTNSQGTHNVNGSQATFPGNPASFGNQVGAGWVYEYTFQTAGTYDYQCDPHAAFGMNGQVIVEGSVTGPEPAGVSPLLRIYPNPAHDVLHISAEDPLVSVSLVSVTGNRLVSVSDPAKAHEMSLEGIAPGIYFVEIVTSDQKSVVERIIKK